MNLRRIETKLTAPFVKILDLEEAPLNVCRWIAWGRWHHIRVLRTALALWFRRPVNPLAPGKYGSKWAWGTDAERSAVEVLFRATPQHATLVRLGLLSDADQDLPYREWDMIWPAINKGVTGLDRDEIAPFVKRTIASRKKRKRHKVVRQVSKERALLADILIRTGQSILNGGDVPESLSELVKSVQ